MREREEEQKKIRHWVHKVQRQLEEKVDLVGPGRWRPQALGGSTDWGRLRRRGLQRRIRWMEQRRLLGG